MRNEIVVGLDNSPSGKAALNWAAEQARSLGTTLRAVHALDWPYGLSSIGFPAPLNYMDVSREEIEDSYREAITAVFDAVSPRPNWILQFASGDAGHILVEQAKDAHLLVVGTREHAGLRRLLSGSVSHHCLSHAVCPVVAVPAPASDRRAEDSDNVGPDTTAGIDQDLETMIPAAEKMIDEAEVPGTRLLVVGVEASAESLAAVHYAVTAAEPGDPVTVLKWSARRAAMLVLGRDHVSWGERLLMGAVASQVVSQVECPLVVVPGGWRARHAWPRLPVIVALDGQSDPEPALQLAFEEARLRDARLIALHAQPIGVSAGDKTAAQLDLAVVLANWEQDHPDVAVSTAVVSGDPEAQLQRWSRSAAVLVIGHPHRRGWGDWTRSVARSVMRQTHCPLIVAPQARAESGRHRELADQALN
jgi:nucleotide-binding universal stress UspA family protein